jgi:hypothetical protein
MREDHEHRRALLPFSSFGLANVYAFVSGIFLSLALNLLVSVLLADRLRIGQKTALFSAAFAFLVSSAGFFVVNWNLEIARNEWLAEGASQNQKLLLEPIEARLRSLYSGLLTGLSGLAIGVYLIACRSIPFLHLE